MTKLAIYFELDDAGKDTGRVQVVDEEDDLVVAVEETEEKADVELKRLQAEYDMWDKIKASYLAWEEAFLKKNEYKKEELRDYLVNCVIE